MPRDPWQNGLNELRRDHRSGASEILAKALDLLIAAPDETEATVLDAWHDLRAALAQAGVPILSFERDR